MTMLHPERVVAVFLRSASAASFRFDWHVNRPGFRQPEVPAAVYTVPIMCNAGVKEKPENGPLWRWNGVWEGELATFHIASVAYWYQTELHVPFPKLPSKDKLEVD
jgi:hypothetical protein